MDCRKLMIAKELDAITEEDLRALVATPVAEGRTIEYKSALPGATNEEKVKFLRAVSSLANTAGGDLVIGVAAQKGVPTEVPGVSVADADGEMLRLQNLMREAIQHRIRGVHLRFVPMSNGNAVLIVRVPRSFNAPHRVKLGGHTEFYARNSNGGYPLDVPELRSAFLETGGVADKVRHFRENRLALIGAGETPVPLVAGGRMAFHIASFGAFLDSSLSGLELTKDEVYKFAPPNSNGMSLIHNFDGYAIYYGGEGPQESYVQVFRSGVVEYVMALHHQENGAMRVNGTWIEEDLFDVAPRFSGLLNAHGVTAPYYFMLSLLGVRNHIFDTGSLYSRRQDMRAGRDNIVFPEIASEHATFDVKAVLRPLMNRLWNTFGYASSMNYAKDGSYVGPRRR
jgi:hypothetical protein